MKRKKVKRVLSAVEVEEARKAAIRLNMGVNGGEKERCKSEVNAGRADPRSK